MTNNPAQNLPSSEPNGVSGSTKDAKKAKSKTKKVKSGVYYCFIACSFWVASCAIGPPGLSFCIC